MLRGSKSAAKSGHESVNLAECTVGAIVVDKVECKEDRWDDGGAPDSWRSGPNLGMPCPVSVMNENYIIKSTRIELLYFD